MAKERTMTCNFQVGDSVITRLGSGTIRALQFVTDFHSIDKTLYTVEFSEHPPTLREMEDFELLKNIDL